MASNDLVWLIQETKNQDIPASDAVIFLNLSLFFSCPLKLLSDFKNISWNIPLSHKPCHLHRYRVLVKFVLRRYQSTLMGFWSRTPHKGVCSVCVSVFSGYRSGSSGWHESCCVQPPAVYILLCMGHHPGRCKHTVPFIIQPKGGDCCSEYLWFWSIPLDVWFYQSKRHNHQSLQIFTSAVTHFLSRWMIWKAWIHATLHVFTF